MSTVQEYGEKLHNVVGEVEIRVSDEQITETLYGQLPYFYDGLREQEKNIRGWNVSEQAMLVNNWELFFHFFNRGMRLIF